SLSSSDSRHSSSKHKKSKRKHRQRSRSRSRSEDRYSRRDRSPGRRRRSRSHERGRRSRSPARRRSRSHDRSRRSPSPYSRSRRSRSDSRGRYTGRRRSGSRDRVRRSSSRSRSVSRRSSPDRRRDRGTPTEQSLSRSESATLDSIPGFSDMTPAEQAQARLKLALKAAAMADEKLKEQAGSSQSSPRPLDRQNFADAVASIESDSFAPATFKSSRSHKDIQKDVASTHFSQSHDLAMFGAVGSSVVFTKTEPLDKNAFDIDPESVMDASLNCDPEEKMKRWIQKLAAMRRKKIEGEVLTY
ncbi:hypothetical protein BaRGS_00023883, partial [Batillaria attramentaria]